MKNLFYKGGNGRYRVGGWVGWGGVTGKKVTHEAQRPPAGIWDLGSGIGSLGSEIWDLGSGIWDLGSEIWIQKTRIRSRGQKGPKSHTKTPVARQI